MIKRQIFTKLRFQFGRHFFNKMAVPYLLRGIFFSKFWFRRRKRNRFSPKRVSSAVMFFQSSVLEVAKKYIIAKSSFCGSGDTAFSQKKFDLLSSREKQVDFSSLSPKAGRCFQMAKGSIPYNFFSDVSKLFTVVSDQAFSILPMIFLSCPS